MFSGDDFITAWADAQGHLAYSINGNLTTVPNIVIPAGVSPAVAASGSVNPRSGGAWRIDVPDTQGNLFEIGTQAGLSTVTATQSLYRIRGSATGTTLPGGGFAYAFVDPNDNTLWVQGLSTGIKVAPGTSTPAVAADNGNFAVIYDATATGDATVTIFGAGNRVLGTQDTGVKMDSTKSAAITAMSGVTQPNPPPTSVPPAGPDTVNLTFVKQQVASGPIPFKGQYPPFGTTEPGNVLSITYPAAGHANTSIELLKRNFTSADCHNPNDVVILNPGQTTTPAQISALYGDNTSFSTKVPFQAVACFVGTPLPSTITVPMSVQFH